MATLRILHCLRAPVGGLFRHVQDLAAEQNRRGHAVGVLCDATAGDPLTHHRLAELAPHLKLGLHRTIMSRRIGWRDATAYALARDLAAELQIDVIHGHGAKGGAYARLAAGALKRSGRPLLSVYTPHGGSLHYQPSTLAGRIYMGLERRLAPLTDGIVFESAYSAARYADQVGPPRCTTRVVVNGLRPEEFIEHTPRADAADIVFVGELRALKGVDVLLRALKRVSLQQPVRAAIVGAGPDAARFQSLAHDLGLTDHVRFTGALPAHAGFELGRVLVMPSRAESLPYVVLEAAAAGVPLITTHVGGIPEILEGTDTAMVPPGDEVALAAQIEAKLADPSGARARADRLKASVACRFTVAAMADGVLTFYGELRAR
jgi:glycosyltransferase involved in cell wall biosynthesis